MMSQGFGYFKVRHRSYIRNVLYRTSLTCHSLSRRSTTSVSRQGHGDHRQTIMHGREPVRILHTIHVIKTHQQQQQQQQTRETRNNDNNTHFLPMFDASRRRTAQVPGVCFSRKGSRRFYSIDISSPAGGNRWQHEPSGPTANHRC